MGNVDPADLEALEKSFKSAKPRLKVESSLDKAQRAVNFGMPKTITNKSDEEVPVKINVLSPKIKTNATPPVKDETVVQKIDVGTLAKKGEFSATSVAFIPYGAGFITAREALTHLGKDHKTFFILQENYLSQANLHFILTKLDKIFDLSQKEKQSLKDLYRSILHDKETADANRTKATELLNKIKTESFRTKLGGEIERMFANTGDLYKYYSDFDLIDLATRKNFINRVLNIDYYILKKIKEIVAFNQADVLFRYQEILEFVSVLETRNIIMNNFHSQVEYLASQQKISDTYHKKAEDIIKKLAELAKNYGRNGKYGATIARSANLLSSVKADYFKKISQSIEFPVAKLQSAILDLETGDYTSLNLLDKKIESVDIKSIIKSCSDLYKKTLEKKID